MTLKELQNKKIGILGLGIENQAMLRYLIAKKVKSEFTICDARTEEQLEDKFKEFSKYKNIKWRLGSEYNKRLYEFDILFRSPGWPIFCSGIREALNVKPPKSPLSGGLKKNAPLIKGGRGDFLYSPMKLFFDLCPTKNIIGVTGTKGKGTTSSLIYDILKNGKKKVFLGGNIGVAPFEFLSKIKKDSWVVLELSNFQLEDLHVSPHIAVITNFYKEHLAPADPNNPNYHRTLSDYWEAKANIALFQNKKDYAILNYELRITNYGLKLNSKIIKFKKSDLPSGLIGEHNKENIAAAVEVAKIVGIKEKDIAQAVKNFKGLEHRIEFVKEAKPPKSLPEMLSLQAGPLPGGLTKNAPLIRGGRGVKFYNDSFATTPESSITALKSFSSPIILLAGGADKGADFKPFAKEIKKRCKFIVLLDGKATLRLKKDLLSVGFSSGKMKLVKNIKDAVELAYRKSEVGDIVLLSTACASFGMFKNYKERGRLFKEEARKIK